MRKTLPLKEQQLFELFSNFKYELPKDPELMMYDFYFLTAFGNTIQTRNIDADYAVEEATDDVVNSMHYHMKKAVFFSLCAEIRHIFDTFNLKDIDQDISKKDLEFIQEFYKEYSYIQKASDNILTKLMMDNPNTISPRDRKLLSMEDGGGRRASHTAVKSSMKKFNMDRYDFARFCERIFNLNRWNSSYGGKPWAGIARALSKLEEADTKKQKIIWIDHAYDLQHNTDTVFNKIKSYSKSGGYSWIKKALDWKRDAIDMRDYYTKCSPQLQPLISYISKNVYDKTIQGELPVDSLKKFGDLSLGDYVKVTDSDKSIFDSEKFTKRYKLKNWKIGKTPDVDHIFKIAAIGPSDIDDSKMWLGIISMSSFKTFVMPSEDVYKTEASTGPSDAFTSPSSNSKFKFKIGDKVDVEYPGTARTDAYGLANKAGLTSYDFGTLPSQLDAYIVVWTGNSLSDVNTVMVAIQNEDGQQYLIKQIGIKKHVGSSSISSSPSPEIRTASGVHKFNAGNIVKISSIDKLISVDENIKQWGLNNDLVLCDPDDGINHMKDFKVLYTGESDYLPGKTIVLIKQVQGFHEGKVFLINQDGLKLKKAELNFKFAIGDKVKVTNPGKGFSMYDEWASEHGFSLSTGIVPETGGIYTVIAAAPHFSQPIKLYGIEDQGGMKFIMGEAGLEKIPGTYQSPVNNSTAAYEFGVGDKVDVIDPSFAFTNYHGWANKNGFQLDSDDYPSKDFVYTIFAKGPHELHPGMLLYAIKDKNDIRFIMDGKGLKLNLTSENPTDTVGPPMQSNEIEDEFIDISEFSNKWTNVYLEKSAKRFIEAHFKKFKWVTDAYISNAKISLDKNDKLVFLEGTWEDGLWVRGTWNDGTWLDGTWKTGTWVDGTWLDGTWNNGVWKTGTWEDGLWRKGFWRKGTWNGGTWNTGNWNNGIWNNGLWKSGIWKKGIWVMGEIEDSNGVALYSTVAPV